ncbi:uncharacterized protein SCDLUD_000343 [Saccharomycodes ludwigii]|uniref:uncharacterized protein n=1 Tax=Saccharomycodes ludwigii TaxID=36035 RepID=UPI001E830FA0|nr:hypothetical protein SCDLUD_000343 [Saccharomycodes ludwigii]KAH3902754.1 hypothetical protein SCDLUD_000343 [Saccharomycodes ludwigii]
MPAKDTKIHKPTGNGTTHKIRELLNFTDSKKWKKFSSRRLELIDKFKLSEKKASEQDQNIKRIASILRTEFNYPVNSQVEFEKLVTAAVQSVRRNRKRSVKTKKSKGKITDNITTGTNNNNSSFGSSGEDDLDSHTNTSNVDSRVTSPILSTVSCSVNTSKNNDSKNNANTIETTKINTISPIPNNSEVYHPKPLRFAITGTNSNDASTMNNNNISSSTTINNSNASNNHSQGPTNNTNVHQKYEELMKLIISDIVYNRIPLKEQERRENYRINFNTNHTGSHNNPISTNNSHNFYHNSSINSKLNNNIHSSVPTSTTSNTITNNDDMPNLEFFALSSQNYHLLPLIKQQQKQIKKAHSSTSGNNSCSSNGPTSIMNLNNHDGIPIFLREKLILHVNRSRTCLDICTKQGGLLDLYGNLIKLGQSSICSSISFVLERFFSDLQISSIDYLYDKVSNDENLSTIASKIFGPATNHNFFQLPSDYQVKLFQLIFGAIIKDFGFDPCIYPLSEVFNDYILRHYPLVSHRTSATFTSNTSNNKTAVTNSMKASTILHSVSIKPSIANQDVNKKVLLKFKNKQQEFTFHLLSNGPPTINEILENSTQLFNIVSLSKNLCLYHETPATNTSDIKSEIIKDDMELASIFNQFTSSKIILEIKELHPPAKTTLNLSTNAGGTGNVDGLAILSRAASSHQLASVTNTNNNDLYPIPSPNIPPTASTNNNTKLNPPSRTVSPISVLDDIIYRMNTPISVTTSNSSSHSISSSCANGNHDTDSGNNSGSDTLHGDINHVVKGTNAKITLPPGIKRNTSLFANNNLPKPSYQPLL